MSWVICSPPSLRLSQKRLTTATAIPWPSAVDGENAAVSMWLTGPCGSTFGLWLASPAEGCPG